MKPARVGGAPAAATTPRLCIALHDVAPATWPQCAMLLDLLDTLGAPPLTLLVVPDYHRRGRIDTDTAFCRAIDARLARGDELALHGYVHRDEGPTPHGLVDRLRRRVLTAGEGEFAALDEAEAGIRIAAGLALFERLQWPVQGFVAPAWLLGDGTRAALRQTALRYTSTHTHLEFTASGARVAAPAISASARSRWRRWASRRWLRAAARAHAGAPLLRVALHPVDAEHADIRQAWQALLQDLLAARRPVTKAEALARA